MPNRSASYRAAMTEKVPSSASPDDVSKVSGFDTGGDAADQAERLTMIMEAEATREALRGGTDGEGSLDGMIYPLEDTEEVLAIEDADDASDDPMHAGGLRPATWMPAEQAAMHIVDVDDPNADVYASDETDTERANPDRDQFDGPSLHLTPEDETLLGVDPYDD
jgi:hypothetical protein